MNEEMDITTNSTEKKGYYYEQWHSSELEMYMQWPNPPKGKSYQEETRRKENVLNRLMMSKEFECVMESMPWGGCLHTLEQVLASRFLFLVLW